MVSGNARDEAAVIDVERKIEGDPLNPGSVSVGRPRFQRYACCMFEPGCDRVPPTTHPASLIASTSPFGTGMGSTAPFTRQNTGVDTSDSKSSWLYPTACPSLFTPFTHARTSPGSEGSSAGTDPGRLMNADCWRPI